MSLRPEKWMVSSYHAVTSSRRERACTFSIHLQDTTREQHAPAPAPARAESGGRTHLFCPTMQKSGGGEEAEGRRGRYGWWVACCKSFEMADCRNQAAICNHRPAFGFPTDVASALLGPSLLAGADTCAACPNATDQCTALYCASDAVGSATSRSLLPSTSWHHLPIPNTNAQTPPSP